MYSVDQIHRAHPPHDSAAPNVFSLDTHWRGEELFLALLGDIEKIIRATSAALRLSPEDAEDFASTVKVRLIEDDYAVLRRFRGDSRCSTFLTRVIRNLGRDFLVRKCGKWRPSRTAQRLGADLVELETLYCRDGFTLGEAIELILRNHKTSRSREELVELAGELPPRCGRQMLGEDHLASLRTPGGNEVRIEELERTSILTKTVRALTRALRGLVEEDLEILRYQYGEGLSLTAIAAILELRRRKIYTRQARCLRRLRRFLEKEGLTAREVKKILGWKGAHFELDFERCEARAC